MISRSRSGAPSYSAKVELGGVSSRSVLIPISASRLGSVIALLRISERHWLSTNWKVPALRPADVVLGHQDPGQVGVAAEHDAEEIEDLALLRVGGRKQLDAGFDLRQAL